MTTVRVGGRRVRLTPRDLIGSGGEAEVYRLPPDRAVKVYKPSAHPDFAGKPLEQAGARLRLALAADKLHAFPRCLPRNVVTPKELAYDQHGAVVGFALRFIDDATLLRRLSEPGFRASENIGTERVLDVFRNLHEIVRGVHAAGAVIGDFNDLNVLFRDQVAWLIDADSMQWGCFPCHTYTQAFVDPLLCDVDGGALRLQRPHTTDSDWFAFRVMLMRSLLYVGPYGGIYKPRKAADRIAPGLRPTRRITVFHPETLYPKPALPLAALPADLREHFESVFVHDERGPFDAALLDERLWHYPDARVAAILRPATTVHRSVTSKVLFESTGRIVFATIAGGRLQVLEHRDGGYWREDGSLVVAGEYDPRLRYRISGRRTLMALGGQMIVFGDNEPERVQVDRFGGLPIFDANARTFYWLEGGTLRRRDGLAGRRTIGNVLPNRTVMWAGDRFGFGLWHGGELQQAFVFDARNPGINSTVEHERIPGQMLNATAAIAEDRAWFFVQYQYNGKTHHRVTVVDGLGRVVAHDDVEEPAEDHWLASIHGHAAVGDMLFVATDEGIVRVRPNAGGFATTQFVDTAPCVTTASTLLASVRDRAVELAVMNDRQVVRLTIEPQEGGEQ